MAVVNYAASVQGVALRITRLDSTGLPLAGPHDVYVTRAFMRLSFTPEYEEGDEVAEKNAAGEICITYKALDTLKRVTMELAICEPDPEITELISGGVLLTEQTVVPPNPERRVLGYASTKVGEAPNPNGVGIEVWSIAVRDGSKDNTLPYYRWVFPKSFLRPSGDRVIENGVLANTFEGYGVGNLNFGTGPADTWPWPDATDRPFLYSRDIEANMPWADAGDNGWATITSTHEAGSPKPPASATGPGDYQISDWVGATGPTGPTGPITYPAEDLVGGTGP